MQQRYFCCCQRPQTQCHGKYEPQFSGTDSGQTGPVVSLQVQRRENHPLLLLCLRLYLLLKLHNQSNL